MFANKTIRIWRVIILFNPLTIYSFLHRFRDASELIVRGSGPCLPLLRRGTGNDEEGKEKGTVGGVRASSLISLFSLLFTEKDSEKLKQGYEGRSERSNEKRMKAPKETREER